MRLNLDNYRDILNKKGIEDETARKAAGLSKTMYQWLMNGGGGISCETLEAFAEALECPVNEILRPDYEGYSENVIEWAKDGKTATLCLSQRRTISRVKELAEKYPEKCKILAENKDGSLYAHIPTEWIRINPDRELSEEQRQKLADNMRRNLSKTS